MIELKWENQSSFIYLKHIRRIKAMAKENKNLFYVAMPTFVYDYIKKEGINAKVELLEKELITNTITSGGIVLLRISREENPLKDKKNDTS